MQSVGDAPLTVESSSGYLFGLRTIWLLADESLRTAFQVVPKTRVKVGIASNCSSFSGMHSEDHLVLTFLSQKLIG